jgi:hypothetical protein
VKRYAFNRHEEALFMNTCLRSFLIFALFSTFAFSTRAQTAPAPSARFLAGRQAGEDDAKRGIYIIKRWGLDPPSVGNRPSKEEFYRSVLADRYQIRSENSVGCNSSFEEIDEFEGYNAGVRAVVETIYGNDFFARIEREANAEWESRYGEQDRESHQHSEPPLSPSQVSAETISGPNAFAPPQVATPPQTELKPPAKRKFDYPGKIATQYDPEKNQSMVFFALLPIKALETPHENYDVQWSDERLEFSAYFVYDGKQFATPHWVTLAFLSSTENPQKYKDHALRIKADGQWLELGAMKVLDTVKTERRGEQPLFDQALELPITYEQFLQLANAKKLKVKFGSVEFDLEKEQLEAIRDLAVHTVP